MTVDLKPVAMDVCLNTSTQLPTGQICQPVLDAPRYDLDGRRVLRPQPGWRVTHHPSGSSEEAGDRLAGTTERGRSRRWARTPSRPGSPGTRARLARAHQVETAMAQAGDPKSPLMADAASRSSWWAHHAKSVVSLSFAIPRAKDIVRQPVLKAAAPLTDAPRLRPRGRNRRAAGDGGTQKDQGPRRTVATGPAVPHPRSAHASRHVPGRADVNGEQRSVVVHVTEDVALALSPDQIGIRTRRREGRKARGIHQRGQRARAREGPRRRRAEDDAAHCRALRGALQDVGDTMKNLDDFAVALGRRYRAITTRRAAR